MDTFDTVSAQADNAEALIRTGFRWGIENYTYNKETPQNREVIIKVRHTCYGSGLLSLHAFYIGRGREESSSEGVRIPPICIYIPRALSQTHP